MFGTLFYLPAVLSGVSVALMWMWLLNPDYGDIVLLGGFGPAGTLGLVERINPGAGAACLPPQLKTARSWLAATRFGPVSKPTPSRPGAGARTRDARRFGVRGCICPATRRSSSSTPGCTAPTPSFSTSRTRSRRPRRTPPEFWSATLRAASIFMAQSGWSG